MRYFAVITLFALLAAICSTAFANESEQLDALLDVDAGAMDHENQYLREVRRAPRFPKIRGSSFRAGMHFVNQAAKAAGNLAPLVGVGLEHQRAMEQQRFYEQQLHLQQQQQQQYMRQQQQYGQGPYMQGQYY